jgi:CRISPR-associated protein Csy1
MNNTMSDLIKNYIQARADVRLEKFDKEVEKQKKESPEQDADLANKRIEEAAKYGVNAWLTDAAIRAKQISFATHPPKFTHSDAKGSSVYITDSKQAWPYLCTATLQAPASDVVGNAAALDVAGLLQLAVGGVTLANQLAQNDVSSLQAFTSDEAQLAEWLQGFKQALSVKELRSHALAKQLYFPVASDSYHLISPLFSSSMAQALHERIGESRYSEEAKAVRKLKREDKFSTQSTVDYLNVAVQTYGGTKPQNISLLNSGRRGQAYLLSCRPPVWDKKARPPANKKDAFWREYSWRTRRISRVFKEYLLSIKELDSTKPRRDRRAVFVDDLIESLLQFAAEIQQLGEQEEFRCWSALSQLNKSEQLWLDPWRGQWDEAFKADYEAKDWQSDIANQFASWLNFKLMDDKLLMKDVEHREWSNTLEEKIASLRFDLGVGQEEIA